MDDTALQPNLLQSFFVNWYRTFGRDFPWRQPGLSPFACLLTELLLRQTRAEHVARIWTTLIHKYPDADSLVRVDRAELEVDVGRLGFGKQRSAALKQVAAWLCEHYEGEVPDNESALLTIPHVGLYTARAVLCFAFGHDLAIVDTNILRFFCRYSGLRLKRLDNRCAPQVWKLAEAALPIPRGQAREHNYGLLDFAAVVCKARNPGCNQCPLAPNCKSMSTPK